MPSAMITVLLLLRTGSRQQHEDCGEERNQFGFRALRVPSGPSPREKLLGKLKESGEPGRNRARWLNPQK
jgi:hypothetical protein